MMQDECMKLCLKLPW